MNFNVVSHMFVISQRSATIIVYRLEQCGNWTVPLFVISLTSSGMVPSCGAT